MNLICFISFVNSSFVPIFAIITLIYTIMFSKETYTQRRALLKKTLGSGVLLFLGNDECGLNYEDNTFRYRQDSTFLYYFGLSFAGLSAIIDIDEDKEIIFGDELTIDHIVWMGTQPTLKEKSERVGVDITMPSADIVSYLHKAVQKGQAIHYLPPYRAEHKLKLMDWLGGTPSQSINFSLWTGWECLPRVRRVRCRLSVR